MVTNKRLNEKMQRKPVNQQIQLKHRYESFETKFERKRRRKLFKERQRRKANDEELDFDIDDGREQCLLQRISSLSQSISNYIQTKHSQKLLSCVYNKFSLK